MRFQMRKTVRLGPLLLRFTERGFSSWGVRLGRFTKNLTRGTWSFDTPGPGSIRGGGRGKRR